MPTTTSFEDWLRDEGPADEGERDDLLQALRAAGAVGRFRVMFDGRGGARLSGGRSDLKLVLKTEKAAYAFLKKVEGLTFHSVDDDEEDEDDPDVSYRQAVDGRYS